MGNIIQHTKSKINKVAFLISGFIVAAMGLGLSVTASASADSWNNNWNGNSNWNWSGWNNWDQHEHFHHHNRFFVRRVFDPRQNRVIVIIIDGLTGRSWQQW